MAIEGEITKMVLVDTIEARGLSSLRIRRTRRVRNREKRSNPNMMIPLYVIDMVEGISRSV